MRPYRDAVSDNSRWQGFKPRPDDIFVCTPAKCGTTWMQTIVVNLLWPKGDAPAPVSVLSPWIEAKFIPLDGMHAMLESQNSRRVMKSHTPADGIPWYDDAKYIFVGRDGRDAFMSMVNHWSRLKITGAMNEQAEREGVPPLPSYDGDITTFFDAWLGMQNLYFGVAASYWARRERANILFVHFNDLKRDLDHEMRRVANFLGLDARDPAWPTAVQRSTFEAMRNDETIVGDLSFAFEGGTPGFIFKGTNGRWRDQLTAADLERYAARATASLPSDALAWLHPDGVAPA